MDGTNGPESICALIVPSVLPEQPSVCHGGIFKLAMYAEISIRISYGDINERFFTRLLLVHTTAQALDPFLIYRPYLWQLFVVFCQYL